MTSCLFNSIAASLVTLLDIILVANNRSLFSICLTVCVNQLALILSASLFSLPISDSPFLPRHTNFFCLFPLSSSVTPSLFHSRFNTRQFLILNSH